MTYTTNYQLPQWVKSDRIMMDDFNDAMEKIEGGLSEKVGVTFGTYTGNGAASRIVSLGFRPKAVFVLSEGYFMYWNASTSGGLAVDGAPVQIDNLTGGGNGNGGTYY